MDGYVQIGTKLDTKDFDAEIKYIESQLSEIEHKLKQADMGFEVGDTQKLEAQYSRLIKQLDKLQKKQADMNKTDLSKIQNSIENIGNSTGKTIKRLGKWALGIFAIESAYGFVRQAMSSITQYNEQIGTDVEYIRFSLASMLQPVIETLINLVYKLLTYINYVAQQWFGINLFANASADAFNKADKNAKKLQKTMAGFDEMNVLSDSGSSSSQGNMLPSFDLSKNQIEIPNWLKSITDALEGIVKFAVDHPELIIGILGGAKLVSWLAGIVGTAGVAGGVGATGLLGIASILAIIAGVNIANVVSKVVELNDALDDSKQKHEGNTVQVEKYLEKVENSVIAEKQFINMARNNKQTIGQVASTTANYFKNLQWGSLRVDLLTGTFRNYEKTLEETLEQEELYAKALDTAYEKTDKTQQQTSAYIDYLKQYRDTLQSVNDKVSTNKEVSSLLSDVIQQNNDKISTLNDKISLLEGGLGGTSTGFSNLTEQAGISNGVLDSVKKTLDNIKSKKVTLDIDANASKAENAFKNLFNNNLSRGVENIFKGMGLNIKLPKLAVGGVINMPGRGINYGGANIGERGAEGVIPLTNSQMMAELGQAIGRYVNINATVPVYVGNRQIAREIKKINADNDFASNG